jgi:hypothetical protein
VAAAQQVVDASQTAMFHFGPLSLTPRLAIQNLGVDTNVFNSAETPVRDTTLTVAPGVDVWLRAGRVRLASQTTTEWLYYRTLASQRSFNAGENLRIDVDLARVTPRVGGLFLNTRARPNDEVDARVQQHNTGGSVGMTVPAGSRLKFDLDARRTRYDYSQGAYGNPNVADALNRDSDVVSLAGTVEVTVLTSLAVRLESIRDRFTYSTERDSDSLRVMPGVIFEPFAFVSGRAFVGYRRFEALDPGVPDYSGLVADVELKYVALDMFRVVGRVKRDLDYSLDETEPYYVTASVGVEATQLLGLNWDVVGRARHGTLTYPELSALRPGRVDTVDEFGAGVGRRFGERWRVGFDVNYVRRVSAIPSRTYDGLRVGGSFVYGY